MSDEGALIEVADIIRASARRATDLVFRYGGEEFCVVSSGISAAAAAAIAESIAHAVRDRRIPHVSGERGLLTVSVGVAHLQMVEGDDTEALLRRADNALYRAKTRGRDRVEIDESGVRDPVVLLTASP